jgi:iron complex transport system substrate-binding protein
VHDLPVCSEPKINVEGASYRIDQRVKAILQEGLSVYRVDADALRELRPDVVITQTQCDVCAVSLSDVQAALGEWSGAETRVVALQPNALNDVWQDIRAIAAALGQPERGDRLVARLYARMEAITRTALHLPGRPTVACIEWIEPLMAAGNWMPELVHMAGGINLFGQAGQHSPWLTWPQVVTADPEVLLVLPCGFDIDRTRVDMPVLAAQPGWPGLRAVRQSRVYLLDGNQYFNRPGPRLVESLEILAEVLHPEAFDFGHRGSGWLRYRTA